MTGTERTASAATRAFVASVRAANFPKEQLPELQRQLRSLRDPQDQARAGLQCRGVRCEDFLAAGGDAMRIAVTGNFSCQAVADVLRCRLMGRGLFPQIHLSGYNQYRNDFLDERSAFYGFEPRLAVCLLDEHGVLDETAEAWTPEDIERALAAKRAELTGFAERFPGHCSGLLVFNTIPLSAEVLRQRIDYRGRARISRLWAAFNADLCALAERFPHVLVLDVQALMAQGLPLRDARLSFYAKAHMSDALMAAIAGELAAIALARAGKARKCLVVDLDNTLWGGVLGDDGIDGVDLGATAAGEAFVAFQRTIRRLAGQGVLLAVSSKNDPRLVERMLRERADMVLKEDDFAVVEASWGPKSEAIGAIARRLNIGLDSIVFVDDSAFECAEAAAACPAIEIIQLGTEPAEHVAALIEGNGFSPLELNEEDRRRGELYRVEARRQDLLQSSGSLDDFLASLDLTLRLFTPKGPELARVSQLTLRTNQFNMTARRMSEAEVREWLDRPGHGVIALQSGDRFGDNGLIGCIFLHTEDSCLHIDNVLLSCRVFSRGLETAALNHLLRRAKEGGWREVRARFLPTAKNGPAAGFYERHGFAPAAPAGEAGAFRHDLAEIGPIPSHLKLTASDEEQFACSINGNFSIS